MDKTRLLIVDDQQIYAEGLKYVIESRTDDFVIVGIASNGEEALTKSRELKPDVILMDVRMPVVDGVEATRRIIEKYPDIKILILTTFDDDEYVRYTMEHGAVGYLLKNKPPEELIDSLRALNSGILQIDPAVSGKLFQQRQKKAEFDEIVQHLRTLTQREREVIRLLVEAKTVVQISKELEIAEQTVRNHVSNIYFKLGIHNKIEIIRYINQIRYFLEHEEEAAE